VKEEYEGEGLRRRRGIFLGHYYFSLGLSWICREES
jgi:hypothetical protein